MEPGIKRQDSDSGSKREGTPLRFGGRFALTEYAIAPQLFEREQSCFIVLLAPACREQVCKKSNKGNM